MSMKKLICICLSFLICLATLACGILAGNNFAPNSTLALQEDTKDITTPQSPAAEGANSSPVLDGTNKDNIGIAQGGAKTTSGEFSENETEAGSEDTTSNSSDAPVYSFELHAWGKIWRVEKDSQNIDPEFSYSGNDADKVMPIPNDIANKASEQQKNSANSLATPKNIIANNNKSILAQPQPAEEQKNSATNNNNISTNNAKVVSPNGDAQINNSTTFSQNNGATNNTTKKIMPRINNNQNSIQAPSIYPTNPKQPRHTDGLNNTINKNSGNTAQSATPKMQKPNRPAPSVEHNNITTPEGNRLKNNNSNPNFNKNNSSKITAPYGSKTSASLGAASLRSTDLPNAIFVKKLFKASAKVQKTINDAANEKQSAQNAAAKETLSNNLQQDSAKDNSQQTLEQTLAPIAQDNTNIEQDEANIASGSKDSKTPMLAIVIDDFGGWERTGVQTLLDSDVDITCAIIPFADNSEADYNAAIAAKKEVILHMPMEAHVNLPKEWYGTIYISNSDTPESAIEKLEKCLASMPQAKGFNFHIGSGVNKNLTLMKALYHYALAHNMFFLDSRTIVGGVGEQACSQEGGIYLGRDVFLEPEKNRSYQGVYNRLEEGMQVANQKGVAVVIGHVGAEGGENTAKCISDHAQELAQKYGVKIVPISQIYSAINNKV